MTLFPPLLATETARSSAPPDSIDAAEDRERWQAILEELDILQPLAESRALKPG